MECASFPSRGILPWLCCCLNSKAISSGMLFNLGMPMRRCSWSLKQRDAEFCPTLPHSLRPPEGLLRHVTLKQELVKCKSRIILPCWISLTELFGTASKNRSCSDARGGGRELILLFFFFLLFWSLLKSAKWSCHVLGGAVYVSCRNVYAHRRLTGAL